MRHYILAAALVMTGTVFTQPANAQTKAEDSEKARKILVSVGRKLALEGNDKHLAYVKADADAGNPESQWVMGEVYSGKSCGIGLCDYGNIRRDAKKAFHYWSMAAKQGQGDSAVGLAGLYKYGRGTAIDKKQYVMTMANAVNMQFFDPELRKFAMNEMGNLFLKGDIINPVIEQAAKLFQGSGNAEGLYEVAFAYETGRNTEKSMANAVRYYQMAADLGHADAQADLGALYYEGDGVPQSYSKAYALIKKAVDANNPDAMFYLAYMYKEGNGVPKSIDKARFWFKKLADAGDQGAKAELGKLR